MAVRKTNWFAIWITIAVVVVIVAVAGIVIAMNNKATSPAETPTSSHITKDGGIVFGDSKKNTITTYIDFLCPICNQFEQAEGPTIKQQMDSGKAQLVVQPVAILDNRTNPTGYSSRAGSAMYSVTIHDYAHAYAFMQALYANQPQEGSAGLTDQQIIDVAKKAGVNMTSELEKEINANKYQKYVQAAQLPSGATGTPTLVINGTQIPVTLNPQTDILPHLK
ncbi:DSBA oxidoreductase [Microbacterium mangrovi]|uniref:DSBA oxidoreductase n=1 Tax=Microbacterium mangrovi TaxID=1348253 RepID=A0A0B1ZXG2_9MICO|nr:thioredoxin domain-containing protein [Microbacterium mangrovi]KHK95434.1 DSBA oxidoreductase [Microbacterium mangrovi]